jgi:arylformamidase
MKIYDISLTLAPELPVWPGDPKIFMERLQKIEDGDAVNVTRLDFAVHAGTHVDAPVHWLAGTYGVDQLPLDALVGPVLVVELPDSVDLITADVLAQVNLPVIVERILFKTKNSALWTKPEHEFQTGFVALDESAARVLLEHGVKLIGVDYLSVAPFSNGRPTHELLLGAGVVLLEGVNLWEVPPGNYEIYCLPVKLAGADGAPARTILVER